MGRKLTAAAHDSDPSSSSHSESSSEENHKSADEFKQLPKSRQRPAGRESEMEEAEIVEEEVNFDDMMQQAIYSTEQIYKPRIFRHTALKNFLAKSLAELNPDLSL